MTLRPSWLGTVLAAVLLTTAVLKIWAGHPGDATLLPAWLFYTVSGAELFIAVVLMTGMFDAWAALVIAVGCGFGIGVTLIWPDQPCGCLGAVDITPRVRLMILGTLGVGSVWMMSRRGLSARGADGS